MTQAIRPGGRKPLDINDKDTLDSLNNLTSYALDTIAEQRAAESKLAVSSDVKSFKYSGQVVSAESQIVAGVNYYIKVRMNDASCTQQCSIEECSLVIWVKPWENFRNLTKFDCNTAKPEGSLLVGASSDINLDDNSQAALDAVIARINRALGGDYYHKIKNMLQSKRQIVAGNNYKFEFTIAETNCKKSDKLASLNDCVVSASAKPLKCSASVLDKAWTRVRYSNVRFNCKNE